MMAVRFFSVDRKAGTEAWYIDIFMAQHRLLEGDFSRRRFCRISAP
jgi:hypothetical protein